MTWYPCTNRYQEVIFFANLMYLSSHLGKKKKKKNACPTFLPFTQVHFFMICETYLQFNPLVPSLVTGFCLLAETILCVSMWQPTAWLDSSSYPSLFFHLFLLLFLPERVKEYDISDEIVWGYKLSHSAIIVLPGVLTECFWIYAQQWAMAFYFRSLWEEMFTVKKEKLSRCWALGTVVK